MRNTFIKTLTKLAEKDENIYLLTGDLGFTVFEDFAEKFPKKFINCGVAEQNMMGVAAGLALTGKKVYVYSIIPFATMRCFEQIRNDICYQNLDVKIIGMGAGFSYGDLGATHYGLEDIGILKTLPNMAVFSPADPKETEELVNQSYETSRPSYIRLARKSEKEIYNGSPEIKISQPSAVKDGDRGTIIAYGAQVGFALEAAEELEKEGHRLKVISLHTIKPLLKDALLNEISGNNIFVVEEHNIIGGVGSDIAGILAESGWRGNFKRLAVPDEYPSEIGSADYLRRRYHLDKDGIKEFILKNLK